MSDGHSDGYAADIRVVDANNKDIYINDLVWFSDSEGNFRQASIVSVYFNSIELLTRSNQIIYIDLVQKKHGVIVCNKILIA